MDRGYLTVGKVADAVQDVTNSVIDKVVDDALGLENVSEGLKSINNVIIEVFAAPGNFVDYMLWHGDNFNEAFGKSLRDIAVANQGLYTNVLDKWLGLDDSTWLGSQVKDLMYDHAMDTIGTIAIVALVVVSWYLGGLLSGVAQYVGGLAASYATAATSAAVYYAAYSVVYIGLSVGISLLYSGLLEGIFGELMTPDQLSNFIGQLSHIEKIKEQTRMQNFTDIMDGTVFEKMAGGYIYNNTYAGGDIYAYDQKDSLDASVGGQFQASSGVRLLNFVDGDQAGNSVFEKQFDLNLINTDVNAEGRGTITGQRAAYMKKTRDFNAKLDTYNSKQDTYNKKTVEYQAIIDEYNARPAPEKTKANYDATVARLGVIERQLTGISDELSTMKTQLEDFWKKPWEK
jgi:hypothetical protein